MSRSLHPSRRGVWEKPRRLRDEPVRVSGRAFRTKFAPAHRGRIRSVVAIASLASFFLGGPTMADDGPPRPIRIATLNASLYGKAAGEVADRLDGGDDSQAESIASVVRAVRPDLLLINELDYDIDGKTARRLAENHFAKSRGGRHGIEYPHILAIPSNTGVDSGIDLNANGELGEPTDAWGYGVYPGQYAMAVFSRFPIDRDAVRSFRTFLWKDLPGALRPIVPDTGEPYYPDEVWNRLRLSSKNHVDVPVRVGSRTIHLLVSHPTPPVFDGPEDRNGCRNHDEIRFWIDYLQGPSADHLVDDDGNAGGLPPDASFVILGDLNADPSDGDGRVAAIRCLLAHRRVNDPKPSSRGAADVARGGSSRRSGPPELATADFGRAGTLRVDYVLPSRDLEVGRGEVFWPRRDTAEHALLQATDHRMVWIEVAGW